LRRWPAGALGWAIRSQGGVYQEIEEVAGGIESSDLRLRSARTG
jgi:hypothetical protein